tara:strand:- start:5858 stop:6406 length:549 start_codon:yes stop_codon:yes gene_type:complete
MAGTNIDLFSEERKVKTHTEHHSGVAPVSGENKQGSGPVGESGEIPKEQLAKTATPGSVESNSGPAINALTANLDELQNMSSEMHADTTSAHIKHVKSKATKAGKTKAFKSKGGEKSQKGDDGNAPGKKTGDDNNNNNSKNQMLTLPAWRQQQMNEGMKFANKKAEQVAYNNYVTKYNAKNK